MSVDASLQAIETDLNKIMKKLVALQDRDVVSTDEISPLQKQLDQIDQKRNDGKFMAADGSIPAGQGTLNTVLSECYEMAQGIVEKAQKT